MTSVWKPVWKPVWKKTDNFEGWQADCGEVGQFKAWQNTRGEWCLSRNGKRVNSFVKRTMRLTTLRDCKRKVADACAMAQERDHRRTKVVALAEHIERLAQGYTVEVAEFAARAAHRRVEEARTALGRAEQDRANADAIWLYLRDGVVVVDGIDCPVPADLRHAPSVQDK